MSFRFRFALTALCALSLGLLAPAALRADNCTASDNLVQNCSFSTGDFTGWTVTDAATGTELTVFPGVGYNGDNAASFAAFDNKYDTIAQTLSTTPGEEYTLTFWLDDELGIPGIDTDFQALWDGTSLLDQDTTTAGFVEYTYTVTGTGSSDTLLFEGYNTPRYYLLSDISLTPDVSLVAEPSSFLLLGTGLLGIAGLLRQRYTRN